MEYRHEAILRDGASIMIRALRPDDRGRLVALFASMSPRSIRHRFFGAKAELLDSDLAYLESLDGSALAALAATTRRGADEQILGIGRYIRVSGSSSSAEVAFEVGDADHGRGIGTLLLDHLARIARRHQIASFRAEVEADNGQMLDVFSRSGFAIAESLDRGVFHVELPIADTDTFLRAAAERERVAAAHSQPRASVTA